MLRSSCRLAAVVVIVLAVSLATLPAPSAQASPRVEASAVDWVEWVASWWEGLRHHAGGTRKVAAESPTANTPDVSNAGAYIDPHGLR